MGSAHVVDLGSRRTNKPARLVRVSVSVVYGAVAHGERQPERLFSLNLMAQIRTGANKDVPCLARSRAVRRTRVGPCASVCTLTNRQARSNQTAAWISGTRRAGLLPAMMACTKSSAPPWKPTVTNARLCTMDTVNPTPNDGYGTPDPEAEVEKQRRLPGKPR